ncbi:MBL fold metallo-hydrolase [Hyphobacterium marinum]|uniref:MBL fold metallo-hydrolase n=1 Tax=Hyphobacterium marinum TaxID=3116574 RepID=A0ABU7LYF4_9PROT|nr:MBL fold metallo-hydrolase [Hyphobacterium sp. Y6023]MEE2566594.1 MBL fold metallo-hydrolase [Hyphobacterium sp. Y6023]
MSATFLRATILGCGSSGGVPRPDGDWGACDPANPKNRRRRCSLLIEGASTADALDEGPVTRVVIDTSPDLREQALSAGITTLDAVLLTHDHADQTHGMDDVRPYALRARRRMAVHMSEETRASIVTRFAYAFVQREGSPYPAILDARDIPNWGETFEIDGPGGSIPVRAFEVGHGKINATGYRIGPFVYTPDVNEVPDAAFDVIKGAALWIVDALRDTPHPTHASVADALAWLERSGVRQGVLTNLHVDLDYDALTTRLPDGVSAAYDERRFVGLPDGTILEA